MNSYKKFINKNCKYYPCHNLEEINCLFCFCPLYFTDCNGNYTINKKGIKNCSECIKPHSKQGYEYIMKELDKLKKNNDFN